MAEPEPVPTDKQKPIYTQHEADKMLQSLQTIYALDDAIANQRQLQRPQGFIQPLIDLRAYYGEQLQETAAKGIERQNKDQPPAKK